MTRTHVLRGVLIWFVLTLLASFASCARMRIGEAERPDETLSRWALAYLNHETDEDAPSAYEGPGPNVVLAWRRGVPLARHIGDGDLVEDVRAAREHFGDEPYDTYTVEVGLGDAPLVLGVPYLRELSLVPLHEGLVATYTNDEGERERRVLSPEELRASAAYDSGIPTPIPDLSVGTDVLALIGRMARDMRIERDELLATGEVRRYRSHSITPTEYPHTVPVDAEHLREAINDAADFLMRHQSAEGQYTYIYEARPGTANQGGYNIPRHSGSTYFLAQVHRVLDRPEAREAAIRALDWVARNHIGRCGENACVVEFGSADVGSAALTVVAAAEVLMTGENATARTLLDNLSAFLRAQQREDGELMHAFDIEAGEPIDVQYLYYSGEAAFALLRAYEASGGERNLDAASRLMTHLSGASWDFLGSQYYYGEEHWTCIAGGEGEALAERGDPTLDAVRDFCWRWYEFNDQLQFREGQTQWQVEGAYGVGPIVMPRLTPVGSRSEAFIGTYVMLKNAGRDEDAAKVRELVERGLAQLMRYRWAPGPVHLFADPAGARGGVPGSPVDLSSRNDFTQHAGSSWTRWYEILRNEEASE